MKTAMIALFGATMLSTAALAAEVKSSTDTDVETNVGTSQNSGITLDGKAKVMPKSTIYTGDNTSTIETNTRVDAESRAESDESRTNRYGKKATVNSEVEAENRSYNRTRGKGHKYGHDKL